MSEKLDVPFFTSTKLGFFEKLIKDTCLGLLELSDVVYPRLVWLFYANMETKSTPKGMFFMSIVKYVKITLSHFVLKSIFGLKFTNTTPSNLTRKRAKDLSLTQFGYPHKLASYKRQNKAPPYHVLFPELRLLDFVFVCIFYPKDHSKEASNVMVLEAIYRLITGSSVDYVSLILDHMYRLASVSYTLSLPYGGLLTCIFQHFKVPLESEECIT